MRPNFFLCLRVHRLSTTSTGFPHFDVPYTLCPMLLKSGSRGRPRGCSRRPRRAQTTGPCFTGCFWPTAARWRASGSGRASTTGWSSRCRWRLAPVRATCIWCRCRFNASILPGPSATPTRYAPRTMPPRAAKPTSHSSAAPSPKRSIKSRHCLIRTSGWPRPNRPVALWPTGRRNITAIAPPKSARSSACWMK